MMVGTRISTIKRSDVHGITTQNSEKSGEFLNLCQGILRAGIGHGGFEINVENVLKEVFRSAPIEIIDDPDGFAPLWPALDLGQIDIPESESREDLEEDPGPFLVGEHNTGLEGAVGSRNHRLPGEHDESGHVPHIVLNAICEDIHAVNFRGPGTGNGGGVSEIVRRHELGGASSIVESFSGNIEAHESQSVLALGQSLGMAYDSSEIFGLHAGKREQAVVYRELNFTHNVQRMAKQQIIVSVYAAAQGIFHWQDCSVCNPKLHGLKSYLELVTGYGLAGRVSFRRGCLAVSPRDSLVGNAEMGSMHWSRGQICDAQRLGQWGENGICIGGIFSRFHGYYPHTIVLPVL